jgi:hypothetical protein
MNAHPSTSTAPLSQGLYVRVENSSNFAWVGNGTNTEPQTQYIAQNPDDIYSTVPVQPGNTTILHSVETGLYCRIANYSVTLYSGNTTMVRAEALLHLPVGDANPSTAAT